MSQLLHLTHENVETVVLQCMYRKDEEMGCYIRVTGINATVSFHPERLETHRRQIEEFLMQLPTQFRKSIGGGWSFLNMCQNYMGRDWTDSHPMCDLLLCLGLAVGRIDYTFPRETWKILPGYMPYLVILDQESPRSLRIWPKWSMDPVITEREYNEDIYD